MHIHPKVAWFTDGTAKGEGKAGGKGSTEKGKGKGKGKSGMRKLNKI
tara:strand:- start:1713 stop:1853 length:141 start_codon:yes stop_codon:yes gene_type:complete